MGAIGYAENDLGVNSILEKTIETRDNLDKIYTTLSEGRDAKRLAEQQLGDREMEITSDEYAKHPEMSATAMKEHLKLAFFKDEKWRGLRNDIRDFADGIEGAEYDRKLAEFDIKIGCARMEELGGYLAYLAAAKSASIVAGTK